MKLCNIRAGLYVDRGQGGPDIRDQIFQNSDQLSSVTVQREGLSNTSLEPARRAEHHAIYRTCLSRSKPEISAVEVCIRLAYMYIESLH